MAEEKLLVSEIEKERIAQMISQINGSISGTTVVSRLHAHLTKAAVLAKNC
jgi:hypothetical protein